jgi:hypothetical protein
MSQEFHLDKILDRESLLIIVMKRLLTPLGFAATISLATYAVIKFLRLEGAILIMFITGTLLSIYFSLYFLNYLNERFGKKIRFGHILGVLIFSTFIFATLLRFNHFWQISGWMFAIGFTLFSFIFIPWLVYNNSKENKHEFFKNLSAGFGLSIISISLSGFIMHWPLHEELFVIGNIMLFLIYLPLHTFSHNKRNMSFDFIFQTLIVTYILILFVFGIFLKWPVTHLP